MLQGVDKEIADLINDSMSRSMVFGRMARSRNYDPEWFGSGNEQLYKGQAMIMVFINLFLVYSFCKGLASFFQSEQGR